MNKPHSDQWLLYLVRGIFAIIFGVMAIVIPSDAFVALVIFLGAFMIADGVLSILFSSPANGKKTWRRVLFVTLTAVAVVVLTFFNPIMAVVAMLTLFAVWSFFSGLKDVLDIINFRGRSGRKGEGWYIISILLVLLIAILIFLNPSMEIVSLSLIFGGYALITGSLMVFLAFRLRYKLKHQHRKGYRRLSHY